MGPAARSGACSIGDQRNGAEGDDDGQTFHESLLQLCHAPRAADVAPAIEPSPDTAQDVENSRNGVGAFRVYGFLMNQSTRERNYIDGGKINMRQRVFMNDCGIYICFCRVIFSHLNFNACK
jgi:hypothetical protein